MRSTNAPRPGWHRAGLLAISVVAFALLSAMCFVWTAPAPAQDLEADVAAAEEQTSAARAKISKAEKRLDSAQQKRDARRMKSRKASRKAELALTRVDELGSELVARRVDAAEEVAAAKAAYESDQEEHDTATYGAIGFAVGSLLLAGLALGWRGVRETPAAKWCGEQPLGTFVAVVGSGLLGVLVIGGVLLGQTGLALMAGGLAITVGLGLAIAAVVARQSRQVERDAGQPLIWRKRAPRWVSLGLAVVLLLFFAGGLGDAVTAEEPEAPAIAAETLRLAEEADGDPSDPPTEALAEARDDAEPLVQRAEFLDRRSGEAEKAASMARNRLASARERLSDAERATEKATARLGKQARAAEREAERAATAGAPSPSSGGGSSRGGSGRPSYSSCAEAPSNIPVPPGSKLDRDGDGIGCES